MPRTLEEETMNILVAAVPRDDSTQPFCWLQAVNPENLKDFSDYQTAELLDFTEEEEVLLGQICDGRLGVIDETAKKLIREAFAFGYSLGLKKAKGT